MSISCLVDMRERELIPLLNWPVKQLQVGDVWIGLSGEEIGAGGLVIERKAVADLEASILDGRYREQRTRLATYCQQTGARPVYIIEGTMDRSWGRLTEDVLQKFLNRLAIRYGIAVIHSDNTKDTAHLCTLLLEQIQEDPVVFKATEASMVSYASTVHVSKKGNSADPSVFASRCLQGCPGVSDKAADAILSAHGGSLQGVLAATEKELEEIRVGARRLGPVVAKRLYNLLH